MSRRDSQIATLPLTAPQSGRHALSVRHRSAFSLTAHTFAHFCVDFACFYQLFAGFARTNADLETVAIGFLTYNTIAFGLQPVIGYACDRRRTLPIAIIGCLMVLAGVLLLPLGGAFPLAWPALLLCALGNACFHVGGGSESLVNANGKMGRSGIFVSSGALGVVLGTLLGKGAAPAAGWMAAPSILVPIGLLALSIVAIWIVNPRPTLPLIESDPESRIGFRSPAPQSAIPHSSEASPRTLTIWPSFGTASMQRSFTTVMMLCLASITIRSYGGSVILIDWRTSPFLVLLPAFGAVAGKAVGGLLADWLGARRTGVISLLASLPLLVFGSGSPPLCVLGIILFNISMSITLCAIADRLPGFPGLSFGLTTLALLVGNVPTYFLALPRAINPYMVGILILASAVCLQLAVTDQQRQARTKSGQAMPASIAEASRHPTTE